MIPLELTPEELVERLLLSDLSDRLCLLDSCGGYGWGGGLLIAGLQPIESFVITEEDPGAALRELEAIESRAPALFFTVSYDFGNRLQGVSSRHSGSPEPDIFAAAFDAVLVHEYSSGQSFIEGKPGADERLKALLLDLTPRKAEPFESEPHTTARFETSEERYAGTIGEILELIRSGETYQTNLTQKISSSLPQGRSPAGLFFDLRNSHPASFSAFLQRIDDSVVSISPERFFRTRFSGGRHIVEASPIKGTRPRSGDPSKDRMMMEELATSPKDRAENIMITDLLRNDLGRVCEYGTVKVDALCEVEELPSLYHLVSTISGSLRRNTGISELLSALFPCGSITGCPKIRTMEIIDRLEPSKRGLSMGSIGFSFDRRSMPHLGRIWNPDTQAVPTDGRRCYDLSVAIRTMTVRHGIAEFNVGGGIVIDSDPGAEYEESLDKAAAILSALGVSRPS